MVKFYITNPRLKSFFIEVDNNITFLEFKQIIARFWNSTFTGFNLINGTDLLDSSKNDVPIKELNLGRVLNYPDNYEPGGDEKTFANLNKEYIRKDNVCETKNSNIPDWRIVDMGINLYGICLNDDCKAKGKQVIMNVESEEFDVVKEGFMGFAQCVKSILI